MHVAYEFVYSHITWFLEILLVLFMGTAAISIYQLNNYNHTVAEVLCRYGGLTPQAADNLEREHNARYGNMFSVTTPDGKRTGPTVPYGEEIYYIIHPKIPFFNTYINAGVNEHVASDVRQAQAVSSRTLTYNDQSPFYKQVKQQADLTSNNDSKDQTTNSLVQAGLFMDNLGEQDAVALVGCTSDQQINITSLTETVKKGDLSNLPASAQAKLQQNQVTLSIAECVTLHKALDSALQSKMPFYAIFVIKHADSTTKTPDYDVVATKFVPLVEPDTEVVEVGKKPAKLIKPPKPPKPNTFNHANGGLTFVLDGDLDPNTGLLTLSTYAAYHNRARWSDIVDTDSVNCTDYLWIGQVMYDDGQVMYDDGHGMYDDDKPSDFYSDKYRKLWDPENESSDNGYFGQLYKNHDQAGIDKFVSNFENIAKKNGQTWHSRDSICTEGHKMIDQLSGRNMAKVSYILGRYQKDGKTMYYLFEAEDFADKHEIASPKIFDDPKVKAAIDKYYLTNKFDGHKTYMSDDQAKHDKAASNK